MFPYTKGKTLFTPPMLAPENSTRAVGQVCEKKNMKDILEMPAGFPRQNSFSAGIIQY